MKRSTADSFACDFRKPSFHLVQPRSAGGREVEVVAGVLFEPRPDLRVLMGPSNSYRFRQSSTVGSVVESWRANFLLATPAAAPSIDLRAQGNTLWRAAMSAHLE